jgi:hypothetical protein
MAHDKKLIEKVADKAIIMWYNLENALVPTPKEVK